MGAVTLYKDPEAKTTDISSLFIDEYMKDANGAQLKVYLYLVRQVKADRPVSTGEIAEKFHLSEREVLRCLLYWQSMGLLSLRTDAKGRLAAIRLLAPKPRRKERRILSLSGETVAAEESRGDRGNRRSFEKERREAMAQLLLVVEQYMGRPLSVSEMQIVYYIRDDLHFPADLVDYLFQYCTGIGRKNFRYIERVAVHWAEIGALTVSAAQDAVFRERQKRAAEKPAAKSRFNDFEQNQYDFEELERRALEK